MAGSSTICLSYCCKEINMDKLNIYLDKDIDTDLIKTKKMTEIGHTTDIPQNINFTKVIQIQMCTHSVIPFK